MISLFSIHFINDIKRTEKVQNKLLILNNSLPFTLIVLLKPALMSEIKSHELQFKPFLQSVTKGMVSD